MFDFWPLLFVIPIPILYFYIKFPFIKGNKRYMFQIMRGFKQKNKLMNHVFTGMQHGIFEKQILFLAF